jgi:predicted lipoprotein with Yx(FWY)xxD motif
LKIVLAILAAAMLVMLGCAQSSQPPVDNMSNADTHGCAAGTSWCDALQKCLASGESCTAPPANNGTDMHGCAPGSAWCETQQMCAPSGSCMSAEDVMAAAQAACGSEGNLSSEITFNNNSRTYWVDVMADKPGCSPACVVHENGSAEVNWRCTGAIPPYTVKTANTSLGEILTDGQGMTLYVFSADSVNKSTCYGTCAVNWPPVLVTDTIAIPKGLPGEMGAIIRDDNTTQVTYNGMPLYAYAADHAPGDANGQGVGGKWYVVTVGMETFPSP